LSAESILEAKAVTKVYEIGSEKVHALTDADLSLAAGEMVLVLGPSGSGKSTLLYAMSGLEKPTKGHVLFKGEDIYALSERRMDRLRAEAFGFVFQAYNLIGNMTALENVEIPLRMAGAKGARKEAIAMLERVGLGHRINHRPGQLSGGEQQRVAIARALVRKPQVLCDSVGHPGGQDRSASDADRNKRRRGQTRKRWDAKRPPVDLGWASEYGIRPERSCSD
jgi:putative ABC transport system ATP-binding protein